MITTLVESPFAFIIAIIGLVLAVTIHEFSHAFVADKLGDPTPRLMGRVTLNPFAHLDPLGSLAILLVGFGWGKPVPFDPFNLQNPRRDAALISLAGPLSNIIFASLLAIIIRIIPSPFSLLIPTYIIQVNLMLAFFNLIPIHPLDGFKIVGGLLPDKYTDSWEELSKYGMIFLLALLIVPAFNNILIHLWLSPLISFFMNLLLKFPY
jgi:Zn-dependent protease